MARGRAKSNRASLALMFAALTLLFVYLANITPVLRAALFFLCSVFVFGTLIEHMVGAAFLTFGAVLFAGFVLVPDKAGMLPYLLFFGHYGIFKYLAEGMTRGATTVVLKLVYFNVCAALLHFFGGGFLTAALLWELPPWMPILLAEAIFLPYDWLFSKIASWYSERIRPALLGRRTFE